MEAAFKYHLTLLVFDAEYIGAFDTCSYMVRCGIAAYGYFDGGIDKNYFAKKGIACDIKPVLPIGYADGLLRRLSPGLKVAINGKAYPIVGTICMDQCMVDIGKNNKNVRRWDKAVVFGAEESGALQDASALAKLGGTISYEILTSISKRVPRVVE